MAFSSQGQKAEGCVAEGSRRGHNAASSHVCRTKEMCAKLCCDTFSSIALQLPWAEHRNNMCHYLGPPEAHTCGQWDTSALKSLMELLVSEMFSLKAIIVSYLFWAPIKCFILIVCVCVCYQNRMTLKWLQMKRTVSHRMKSRLLWTTISPSTTTAISTDSTWKINSPTTAAPLSRVSQSVEESGSLPPASISYIMKSFYKKTLMITTAAPPLKRENSEMHWCLVQWFSPLFGVNVILNFFLFISLTRCLSLYFSPVFSLSLSCLFSTISSPPSHPIHVLSD